MEIVNVPIAKLKPAEYNPRALSEPEAAALRASIERFGMVEPIVANGAPSRQNIVIGGHQRLAICSALGWPMIPVVYVNLPELDRERELNLRLNKNTGHWDLDLLANFGEDELRNVGFSDEELTELFDLDQGMALGLTEADDVPSLPDVPRVLSGDLWTLGRHRLACGDSTLPGVALGATGGAQADLLVTDPPYGVEYEGKTKAKLTIEGDDLGDDGTRALVRDALGLAPLRSGATWYLCSPAGDMELPFRLALVDLGWQLRQALVWVKDQFVMGRQDYHWRHESILTGGGSDEPLHIPADPPSLDLDPLLEGLGRLFTAANAGVPSAIDAAIVALGDVAHPMLAALQAPPPKDHETVLYGWKKGAAHKFNGGRTQDTVWEVPRPRASREHPTMKPVELFARAIRNSSYRSALVLDLFAGSGTTVIACEQTGRSAAVVEKDPGYAHVVLERWEQFTGLEAVLLSRGGRPVE